ncbi:MAG TPA: hypothetical protein VF486_11835 [Actinomycetes bacterium]|jgi:hypothetical protein
MQSLTILDLVARDHVDDLRREARKARLAAKVRRHTIRRPLRPRPA